MGYQLSKDETARHAAQVLLGNAGLHSQLTSPGWDGHPDHVAPGQTFYVKTEQLGPPARHELDNKRWGTNGRK